MGNRKPGGRAKAVRAGVTVNSYPPGFPGHSSHDPAKRFHAAKESNDGN